MKNEKLWNKFNGILSTISIDTYNTVTGLANADDDPKVISKQVDAKRSIILPLPRKVCRLTTSVQSESET